MHYYTVVDSFQYDNQNRVIKYTRIGYDTSFVYDTSGNITSLKPTVTSNFATINYSGNNSIPSGYVVNGQSAIHTANNLGQIITDSLSINNVTHFFYTNGLAVGQFGDLNSYYSVDSTSIDANNNVSFLSVGGNYSLDSFNHPVYGRIATWEYSYGSIPNPVYTNKSASVMLFLFSNFYVSKYIRERQNYITYSQNSVFESNVVSNYQNVADANNRIQKSMNIANDEYVEWTYY